MTLFFDFATLYFFHEISLTDIICTEREAYFYENQEKFCVHSGTMDKKFVADNRKNTPRPQGADKIFAYCVKLFANIPDIPCTICLVIKNFITHSM